MIQEKHDISPHAPNQWDKFPSNTTNLTPFIVYETTRLVITIFHYHHSVLQNWNTNEVWSYNMISNAIIQSHHNFTIEYNFIWSYHRIQSAYFLLDKYCQKGKLKIWNFLKVFSCQKWKRWNHHIRMFGFHIKGWVKILYFISDL